MTNGGNVYWSLGFENCVIPKSGMTHMLAIEFDGIHPFVLLLICAAVMLSLRRASRRRRRFDPVTEATKELQSRKESARAELDQHEVQMHDTAREAQAILQTKVAVLDQMVVEADREIARLEQVLQEIREIPGPRLATVDDEQDADSEGPFFPDGESAQFVRLLHQSGFSAEEIAESMNAPLNIIRDILGSSGDDTSRAA